MLEKFLTLDQSVNSCVIDMSVGPLVNHIISNIIILSINLYFEYTICPAKTSKWFGLQDVNDRNF